MIIRDSDAIARLNSPMNLMNQLKNNTRKSAMSLFIPPTALKITERSEVAIPSFNPFPAKQEESLPQSSSQAPTSTEQLGDILENHESQIKLGLAHDRALDLLNKSVDMLASKLDKVSAEKLPATITAASKVVESIRKERLANKIHGDDKEVHYHFYTPQQRKVADYEVIDVPASA